MIKENLTLHRRFSDEQNTSGMQLNKLARLANEWNFLFENTMGGLSPMADVILQNLERNPRLGLVFPDDPHVIGWTENKLIAENLASRMNMDIPLQESINFPMGTMFWARTSAIMPLFDLNLQWDEYPEEPAGYDGTILHAIERIVPLIVEKTGYQCAVTHVPGVSR